MSNPARTLHNTTTGSVKVEWNIPETRKLLVASTGPVAGFLRRNVGPAVMEAARRRAPVSREGTHGHTPGYLRDSIRPLPPTVENDIVHLDIRARAWYAQIVAGGAVAHEITPKKRRRGKYPLRDKQGHIFGRHVHHPGTRPDRFLQDALSILR